MLQSVRQQNHDGHMNWFGIVTVVHVPTDHRVSYDDDAVPVVSVSRGICFTDADDDAVPEEPFHG